MLKVFLYEETKVDKKFKLTNHALDDVFNLI